MEYKAVLDGVQRCLRNSQDLHREAVSLYEKKSFPRSYFLAVTALEEIGKISILLGNYAIPLRSESLQQKFWEDFFNPRFKMVCSLTHAALPECTRKEVVDIMKFGENLENTKKFALQVRPEDSRSGFLSPGHFIGKDNAKTVLGLLKARLELARVGVANLKKPEDLSPAEKNALNWLRENSSDRDFLTFINSPESYKCLNSSGSVPRWVAYLKEEWTKKVEGDRSRIQCGVGKIKWRCTARIRSYSHTLKEGIFDKWNETADLVKLRRVTDRVIEMGLGIPPLANEHEAYSSAIRLSYATLLALNVATFGHFWWPPAIWPMKISDAYNLESRNEVTFRVRPRKDREWGSKQLTQKNVVDAMELTIGATRLDGTYFEFYGLGLTFLSIPNPEHHFYREVFANFYKIIERLTVVDILGETKLRSEKKQIKKAMAGLGLEKTIVDEFDDIYKIRCRDAMHSWGTEAPVTFEEAGKCKVLCDYYLYKYLEKEASKVVKEGKLGHP